MGCVYVCRQAAVVAGAHDVAVRDVQFNPMALNNFVRVS